MQVRLTRQITALQFTHYNCLTKSKKHFYGSRREGKKGLIELKIEIINPIMPQDGERGKENNFFLPRVSTEIGSVVFSDMKPALKDIQC